VKASRYEADARWRVRLVLTMVIAATAAFPSSIASAQPWVAPEGELTLALHSDYQTSSGVWHGTTLVTGLPVEAINDSFTAEYVPVKHLAVTATLYGNTVAYTGPQMIAGANFALAHGPDDDGSYHSNLTDLELEARYQLYDGAITVTPVVGTRFPVTNYPVAGYAAAGVHLAEGTAGLNLGRYGFIWDDLVLQGSWTFTYVETETGGGAATEQYRTNRTDASFVATYAITDKFIVGVGFAFRYTLNGFNLTEYPELLQNDPTSTLVNYQPAMGLYPWHDPVLRVVYAEPVALASYQVSDSWSLLARFGDIVWGDNVSNAIAFGLTATYSKNLKK
jgi:hypothetical protein